MLCWVQIHLWGRAVSSFPMLTFDSGILAAKRRLPVGAEVLPEGGVHFRVWAPRRKQVEVVLEGGPGAPRSVALSSEPDGYFSGLASEGAAGTLYRYRLDGAGPFPDPASRYQPAGVHGPSEVIDPAGFPWTDSAWRGVPLEGQVIYEMHIGTFTRQGTFAAAARELNELASAGVTAIELMPVADFPGRFGWGYDGVDLYAPTRLYGRPDDLRGFIDAAHAAGIGIILDVVYNHIGPDGNFLKQYAQDYFTDRYECEWGEAINFDGRNAQPVREFFSSNASYWIDEFHFDGLRLDATQSIYDASSEHILTVITRRVREAAGGRATLIIGENEPQHSKLVRPLEKGGYGLDALWNDDYHHSAMVAVTGRKEAYYSDYRGSPQEFISACKYGYLFQGQLYKWQGKRRGTPALDIPPPAFVNFIQNHDQIANSARGERIHFLTSPGRYKAITALTLLAPGTPMLFQGQEFAASTPFLFFADHNPKLASLVDKGRIEFLHQFASLARPEMLACLTEPQEVSTFERCKLDFSERERNRRYYALHKDLLKLRREHAAFRAQRKGGLDGAVLGPEALVLRFFGGDGDDRLLLVNFGVDLDINPAPEPLLAPPEGKRWRLLWSSEHPDYGGCGTAPVDSVENLRVPGHAAVVLWPRDPEKEELERERRHEEEVVAKKEAGEIKR